MTDEELYDIANTVRKNAYSPYSHVCVGAALLTKKGSVYTGVNVENASFGATICAERSAVVQAVGNGETDFEKIAIAVSGAGKSVIYQQNGSLAARKLSALLPDSFEL